MSKQIRLEALKLAVQAGGGVDLATSFTNYIENGLTFQADKSLAKEAEISDDTPATKRRRNNQKDTDNE